MKPPADPDEHARVIICAVMNRLPKSYPWDEGDAANRRYGEKVAEHVREEVRKLWAAGWLPVRVGCRQWAGGLEVSTGPRGCSVGLGRLVGPKPPSHNKPSFTRVRIL